jgi:hypothetical protein
VRYFEHWKETILNLNTLSSKAIIHNCRRNENFPYKQKLKQCITTKPALHKILKGILHTEDENKHRERSKMVDSRRKQTP